MARLTKQPAANATTTRNLLQISLAAFAGVMLIALLATQATAQKRTPGSTSLIEDGIDLCAIIEDSYSKGPFVWELDASKIYDDGTDVFLFALIESYPSGEIGYCSFDAQYVPVIQGLESIADLYGVSGIVEYVDGGAYGAWENMADDGVYFLLAEIIDDYFFLQMTRFSELGAPAVGGK